MARRQLLKGESGSVVKRSKVSCREKLAVRVRGGVRKQKRPDEDQNLVLLIGCGQILDWKLVDAAGQVTTLCELLMRMLLTIRNKSGSTEKFALNDAQRRIAERWGKRNIILKARQLGMTTYVAARFFIETITRPGTLTVQVAHDQCSAEDIFRMVHRFQENLPEELKQGALKTSRANVRQLVWPCLDSEYRVESAADPNAGRGTTIRNLHCSEVARWLRDGAEALRSLRAAVPPHGQVVMESTPQGAGGPFYEEWQHADETGYVRHFLPWWLEKAYRVPLVSAGELGDEEHTLMEKHGLDEEQIVFRRGLRAEHRRMMAQEYAESAEECFLASGDCVFDVGKVEMRLRSLEESGGEAGAAHRLDGRGHPSPHCPSPSVQEYLPVQKRKEYIIGVDPAGGGINGDYACAEVIERASGVQCAELHGHFAPSELAIKVAALAKDYNDALVVVERNNHGGEMLTHLEQADCKNIYPVKKAQKGWLTTVANRPPAIANLNGLLSGAPELFSSPRLLRECRTFVRREDGSPRAAAGTHDDCVMAMAIAQAVRAEG
jgi:hypothetical protein